MRKSELRDLIEETAVHSSLYTEPEVFEQEMHFIFGTTWVFVGHASEIPAKGDFVRRAIGTVPVVMVRSDKDEISVLANRCTHRGNLLCQESSGRRKNLACQYHGWVFSLKGDLLDVPFPAGFAGDKKCHSLQRATVDSHCGFVFANFSKAPVPLAEYLGKACQALERAANLSPVRELDLNGGWVKHLFHANWKMLAENNTDGYHVNYVHDSFARGIKVQYKYDNVLLSDESKLEAVARDLGNGHAEIDYGPTYAKPLVWLGVEPDRFPDYTLAMEAANGAERAHEIMRNGPPHTYIFPNLFIAETAVTMIQPLAAGRSVIWHTPLYWKGVPESVNRRVLRLGEVALGPSAFLLADDAIISERQWQALDGSPGWLDLTRGIQRERTDQDGTRTSHYSDETPQRGFWRHYRRLSEVREAPPVSSRTKAFAEDATQ